MSASALSSARLLALYDQVSDAPDAVPRLRRFVLDLAVRGKLVEQDAGDEPASQLLKRIAAEKARLVKAKAIRKPKALPPILGSEQLAHQPRNWETHRLGDLSTVITKGSTPTSYGHEFTEQGINFLKVESIVGGRVNSTSIRSFIEQRTHEFLGRSQLEDGDILFSIAGSIGTCALVTPQILPANTNQALAIIRGTSLVFEPDFLILLLRSFVSDALKDKARGGAMNNVSLTDLQNLVVPLLPLAEQWRIVARVEELMALLDRLEAARDQREAARDRLTAASYARLTSPAAVSGVSAPEAPPAKEEPGPASAGPAASGAAAAHARFALDALPALTARPDQIKVLRQTILNLAVRGKLVEQDPADERMSQTALRPDADAEGFDRGAFEERAAKFDLPSNWTIQPLSRVAERIVDCPHTTPKWTETGVLCIKTNQVRAGTLDMISPTFVSEETYNIRIERLEPREDDILYIREGGVLGVGCRVPPNTRLCMGQRLMLIRANASVTPLFLELCLNSPWTADFAAEKTTGGAAPRVNMSLVRGYPIPLPPLAEQHRIMAKVDSLMALCDRLEAALSNADTTRARLLEAAIGEALQLSQAVMEAAE